MGTQCSPMRPSQSLAAASSLGQQAAGWHVEVEVIASRKLLAQRHCSRASLRALAVPVEQVGELRPGRQTVGQAGWAREAGWQQLNGTPPAAHQQRCICSKVAYNMPTSPPASRCRCRPAAPASPQNPPATAKCSGAPQLLDRRPAQGGDGKSESTKARAGLAAASSKAKSNESNTQISRLQPAPRRFPRPATAVRKPQLPTCCPGFSSGPSIRVPLVVTACRPLW